jgi:urease accessory protein
MVPTVNVRATAPDAVPDAAVPGRGWQARLELQFRQVGAATRLVGRRHVGPLLVQKALYPERTAAPAGPVLDGPCHVYVIHPPGGVAGGDALELQADLEPGAHALLTTPAAGKFYRRGEADVARAFQTFQVRGAALEWLPQENIFYPNSAVQLRTSVNLSGGARFIGWEIGCLGLPASGRTLEGGELALSFELWRDGRPLLLERQAVARANLSSPWGMAGHSALGTAVFHPAGRQDLDSARAAVAHHGIDMTIACTLVEDVLVCRAVARHTDRLKNAFAALWCALRPAMLGREAVLPRIWAT